VNLGQAVFRLIAGKTPRRADESASSMVKRAIAEAGGVSQLARSIGVARTTVQRWNRGSRPTQESVELLRSVLRHADLSERRAARLAASDSLIMRGKMKGRPGGRTIDLGKYLTAGTMGRAVDAYLRGASPHDLHVIVWAGITDRHYRWMFQPPGGLAQAGPEAVQRAVSGASGGSGPSRGSGSDDDEDLDDGFDDGDADYDGDLLDLAYEGYDIGDNDGYEFSATGASS
jgi:transcriptional regulator with XRE-family HTH domain